MRNGLILLTLGSLCASQSLAQTDLAKRDNTRPASPSVVGSTSKPQTSATEQRAATYLQSPLSFELNRGQVDPKVRFLSRGSGYSLYLTDSGAVLALQKAKKGGGRHAKSLAFLDGGKDRREADRSIETDVVSMELAGAKSAGSISGDDRLPGTTNYFIGNDPRQWRTKVPSYARVRYAGVYPGVDLVYYGNQRRLEYDFTVAAHADPTQVRLHFNGAQNLKLDADGNLRVIAGNGEVAFQRPVVYQDADGRRLPVEGRYALLAHHTVGFKVGRYDRSRPLVIDPTLTYSTYLGGSGGDGGTAIAVDANDNIYVAGYTTDADFPVTAGAFQTSNTAQNEIAFVTKLQASNSTPIYATYLGGTTGAGDDATGIAVDASGAVYVAGEAYSNNFPVTTGAYQTTNDAYANQESNAYISKLSADGTSLVYSTYLGGSGVNFNNNELGIGGGDSPLRIAIDSAGSVYVVGSAYSTDFPTTEGAYQTVNNAAGNPGPNVFVAKLSTDGKSLAYSTYLGGSGVSPDSPSVPEDFNGDEGNGIAIDGTGEAYVTGVTYSSNFPVTDGAYQPTNNAAGTSGVNAFISKLNSTGTILQYSTYLGGSGNGNAPDLSENGEEGTGVVLDGAGNVYVTGITSSADFPTSEGAFQSSNKAFTNLATNAFVSKLDATLSTLIYSTYVGGSGIASGDDTAAGQGDSAFGISVDSSGNAFITGEAGSQNFPVSADAYQSAPRNAEQFESAFLAEINPDGTALTYSTYLGGSGANFYGEPEFVGDFAYDIALDAADNAYLTGFAYSYDFPVTKNALLQTVNKAGGGPSTNTFIAEFGATAGTTFLPTTTTLTSSANPQTSGSNVTFTATVATVPAGGTPTGTVSFYVNSVLGATVTISPTGTATYTTNQLEEFLNDVIAAYSGSPTYGASGISLGENVSFQSGGGPAQLAFTTPPTALIGQGGNGGNATVAIEDADGTPVDSEGLVITVTISGPPGYAPQTLTATTDGPSVFFNFGNNPLTIPGDYTYTASSPGLTSASAPESVAPEITSISPAQVTAGSPAFTLTVTGNFTGLFGDGYDVCLYSPILGTTATNLVGTNTSVSANVSAPYVASAGQVQVFIGNSDSNCTTRLSNTEILTVSNALTGTAASLSIAPSSVAFGRPATLTATVNTTAPPPVPVAPGLVVFCDANATTCNGQFNLGSAQLNASGVAKLPLFPGAVGVHSYKTVFLGTSSSVAATSPPASVTVTGTYPTTTTLTDTGAPGSYNLTGTVVGYGTSSLTPSGSVSFTDQTNSNTVIGTAALGAGTPGQTLAAANGSPITAGTAPYSVATGDFNGDGIIDIAVENYGTGTVAGTVSVYIGNGDGTFAPQVSYAAGTQPEGIVAADVNGDGKLDLIVTNTGSGNVGIYLGNGDGTFQNEVTYPTIFGSAGIVVADFNGDGKPDIAVSNFYNANVGILLGNGDGTFQAQVTYPVGTSPRTLASGDFNGDGIIDLAVVNEQDGTVSILLGNGDGTFGTQITYPIGDGPQGVVVADFNGDGVPDLAVANSKDNSIGILLGNGDGSFRGMTTYAAGNNPLDLVVADFNGDGKADVAVENYDANTESVLLGNGDGTLQAQTVFSTGTNPYNAAVGDFNGDGYPDLVISNFGSNNETILLDQVTSTATAVLTPAAVTGAAGNHNVVAVYPGDANFTASTSPAVTLVSGSGASITLTGPTTSTYGQSVTFSAVRNGFTGVGLVTFYDGQNPLGVPNGTGVGGAVAFTTNALAVGTHSITAQALNVDTPVTSNALQIVVNAVGPTLASISPNNAIAGSSQITVTISGANFVNGAAVTVNGASQAATFISSTQVTTTLTAAELSTAGTLTLAVVNPGSAASNTAAFTVTANPAVLSVSSLSFGNQTVGTSAASQTVTLTNNQDGSLTINQILLNIAPDPSDFTQTNNCPTVLEGGASCQITVVFTPAGVGPKASAVGFYFPMPIPNEFVSLTGVGTGGILQVSPGNLKDIAGNGTAGYSGDGGLATAAELDNPDGIGFDSAGNLYFADSYNNVIRKVDTQGNITTVAGNGTKGFSGDGGPATSAELSVPFSVIADAAGNLYIQDSLNFRIRKVDINGIITTIAGNGTAGFSGDGGPATSAELNQNQGARFDAAGNMYVPQCGNAAVRKIDTNGIITTVAGTGVNGFSGDGGPATSAQLDCPSGVGIDAAGDLFIADYNNNRIRKVDTKGIITTIAGNGTPGFSGDGGPATTAEVNIPNDVLVDPSGNLYIADSGNNRIRKIDTTGVITTFAGGLDNPGSAIINTPSAVALDAANNLYFSDTVNNAIREFFPAGALIFPGTPLGAAAADLTVTLTNIGNVPVQIASQQSFALTGDTTDFSLTGGSCLQGTTLAAAGSCTLTIGFTPTVLGTRTLNVAVTDNAVFSPQSFQISGTGVTALPAITTISPAEVAVGTTSLPLTISGTNFISGAQVLANKTAIATTFVSATQLTITLPASYLAQPGTVQLQVQNPRNGGLSASAPLTVVADLVLTTISPAGLPQNSAAAPITATGSNFTATTVIQFNGTALATTFVSSTQLTATLPATDLVTIGNDSITAYDPASGSVSAPATFAVFTSPAVVFTGPATVDPGGQPPIVFQISQPYPLPVDGVLTLSFTPGPGLPQDPMVLFSNNTQTLAFTLPAGSTATPPVLLMAGTTTGTITVSLSLASNGVSVANVAPIVIAVPAAVPNIMSATLTRGTNEVTVSLTGYSSTRELSGATFNFTPASGATFIQSDFNVNVTSLFTTWYTDPTSHATGTQFTYIQTFLLDGDSSTIGSVTVTLTNSVGASAPKTLQ